MIFLPGYPIPTCTFEYGEIAPGAIVEALCQFTAQKCGSTVSSVSADTCEMMSYPEHLDWLSANDEKSSQDPVSEKKDSFVLTQTQIDLLHDTDRQSFEDNPCEPDIAKQAFLAWLQGRAITWSDEAGEVIGEGKQFPNLEVFMEWLTLQAKVGEIFPITKGWSSDFELSITPLVSCFACTPPKLTGTLDLTVDLGMLRDLRYTFVMLGSMPVTNVERLKNSLEHTPFVLVPLRQDNRLATVVLIGMKQDAAILSRAARSAYLNPLTLPEDYRGTPAQAITALHASIERTNQHIIEHTEEINHLHEMHIRHLRHLLWRVRASHKLAQTVAGYDHFRHTYLVTGWVPTACHSKLEQEISKVSDKVVIETTKPSPADMQAAPTRLQNPSLIRAFEGLVTTYGQPVYGELDPTPLLALTFPLIFGIMFGDVGHGLLLLLVGLLLASRKIHSLRSAAGLGTTVAICGAAAMTFGFLYGSFFGFEDVLKALWFRPLERINDILLFAVAVGIILLNIGVLYNIINAATAKHWGHMIFNRNGLAGLVLYWSLLGIAASTFGVNIPVPASVLTVLAILSGIAVTFAEPFEHLVENRRPLVESDIGTYIVLALFELFETLLTLLSNTLSYVRMGAFAVAHGALSMVVFIIAEGFGSKGSLAYWIIVILGNLFVIGFEGMIVSIQTLRLEYYELFSKFFSGGGIPYQPLSLLPRKEEP